MIQPHQVLVRKQVLTQATFDAWNGVRVELGARDCARMGAGHVRGFGQSAKLLTFGRYRTVDQARAALASKGFADMAAAIDAMGFPRIPHATAMLGDVFVLKSDDGLGALGVVLGHAQVLMSRDGVIQACRPQAAFHDALLGSWRVDLNGRAALG